jgi:1-acyl-sn-glycerol-3-phosphate acyltransferase
MLPPRWVRRLVIAPATVLLAVLLVTTVPLWLLLAAALSPLMRGRLRVLRVIWMITIYLVLESLALLALFGLWVASGFGWKVRTPRFQYAHYRLVSWVLRVLFQEARRALSVNVVTDGPDPDAHPGRPLVVFCRHAGPGDSFLLAHALVNWYSREPRIVLKKDLQWDPVIDVLLNRLPNRFISPSPGDRGAQVEAEIAELATKLDANDAFVLFPEGGNFTPARRAKVIERLHGGGLHAVARRAERMMHVLAPKPGGVAAALTAAPEADVLWVAHTGVDHLMSVADVWSALPMDKTITMRWWLVPAAEVPRAREDQLEWLLTWWERIDGWIAERRAAARSGSGGTSGSDPPIPPEQL